MHISKMEAESEATRIAEAFVSASIQKGSSRDWECGAASPDVLSPGYRRGKTVVKWIVGVRWLPKGGGVCDGDSVVKLDIETKEARWAE